MIKSTPMTNALPAKSQPSKATLYQLPDMQMTSTATASAISKRENGISENTPPVPTPATLFASASEGRRQASLVASRLESLIYQRPDALPGLRSDAMAWLCGRDLTAAGEGFQGASQAIIKRLNDALDGHARRVTAAVLTDSDIAALRIFRHDVRQLAAPPAPTVNGNRRLPYTGKERTFADAGRT